MLGSEDNDALTRVGPRTVMGELLRRFWLPCLVESELAEPDGAPIRLRILGEDLVAFRDTDGHIGILEASCAHRGAHLYFGRNEQCGLRCVYHGWKYDTQGHCVDMPSEPSETEFKRRVSLRAYPTRTFGGVIWIYMGPGGFQPELPDFEWARLPASRCRVTKRLQQCNWAQAVEGGIDSSHISYLHRNLADFDQATAGSGHRSFTSRDRSPVFTIEETDYGLLIGARRNATAESFYWRMTQFLVPFWTMIPPILQDGSDDTRDDTYAGHAWVPIDDENVWTWSFNCNPHRDLTSKEAELYDPHNGMWGPVDDTFFPLRNRANDYELDRKRQREVNYTGIVGIPNQDAAVQESMGPIVDRSRENLGTSDRPIIAFRKRLLRMARALQSGREPGEASGGVRYRVRPASILLGKSKSVGEAAAELLSPAGRPA